MFKINISWKWILLILINLLFILYIISNGFDNFKVNLILKYRMTPLLNMLVGSFMIGTSAYLLHQLIPNKIVSPSTLSFPSIIIFTKIIIFTMLSSFLSYVSRDSLDIIVIIFGTIISVFYFKIISIITKGNIKLLVLFGMVLGMAILGVGDFLILSLDPIEYEELRAFLIGGVNSTSFLMLSISTLIFIFIFCYLIFNNKKIDIIRLGKNKANNLGLDYEKEKHIIILIVSILTTITTVIMGQIFFVGLVSINILLLFKGKFGFKNNIFKVMLITTTIILLSEILSLILTNGLVPFNLIVNIICGISFFIVLFISLKKEDY